MKSRVLDFRTAAANHMKVKADSLKVTKDGLDLNLQSTVKSLKLSSGDNVMVERVEKVKAKRASK